MKIDERLLATMTATCLRCFAKVLWLIPNPMLCGALHFAKIHAIVDRLDHDSDGRRRFRTDAQSGHGIGTFCLRRKSRSAWFAMHSKQWQKLDHKDC